MGVRISRDPPFFMRRKNKNRIKIHEKKLGRERAWGLAWQGENLIEIDPRQSPRQYLNTVIHETLHILLPSFSETKIRKMGDKISEMVWKQNYRRVMK